MELSEANGYGEREAALQMLERSVRGRATLGADRGYDTRDFVQAVRGLGVTPHVARNERGRRSAIDGRTTRHPGYGHSLRQRKLVEEVFGWLKTVAGGRKLRYIDGGAIAPGWSSPQRPTISCVSRGWNPSPCRSSAPTCSSRANSGSQRGGEAFPKPLTPSRNVSAGAERGHPLRARSFLQHPASPLSWWHTLRRSTWFCGYGAKRNIKEKVLDFVQSGGPNLTVGSTTFEVLFSL